MLPVVSKPRFLAEKPFSPHSIGLTWERIWTSTLVPAFLAAICPPWCVSLWLGLYHFFVQYFWFSISSKNYCPNTLPRRVFDCLTLSSQHTSEQIFFGPILQMIISTPECTADSGPPLQIPGLFFLPQPALSLSCLFLAFSNYKKLFKLVNGK